MGSSLETRVNDNSHLNNDQHNVQYAIPPLYMLYKQQQAQDQFSQAVEHIMNETGISADVASELLLTHNIALDTPQEGTENPFLSQADALIKTTEQLYKRYESLEQEDPFKAQEYLRAALYTAAKYSELKGALKHDNKDMMQYI